MSTSYVDEYLVRLGASVDASGMAHFQQALREASMIADVSFASIAGAAFKAQTEIVGGFLAIGTAALGLVDKVAMSDQSFRLFALHMFMSKEQARGLKVAMDALGEPLENLTWDTELNQRTQQLLKDQRAMAPESGGNDFEMQMRKIRDIRFEFTRMEVEGQYLAMHVVQDFMKALGMGPDDLLVKLQGFNNWVTHNLPQISKKIVTQFMPIWHDVEKVLKATWKVAVDLGTAFTNVIGLLAGDNSIEDKTFDFDKFAGAIGHVADWMTTFALTIDGVAMAVADLAAAIALLPDWSQKHLGFVPKGLPELRDQDTNKAMVHGLIDKYAVQLGVDPALAHAVAMTESGEDQSARSKTSTATGVYQLLNGTAATLGVDSTNADQNVRGGITYLKQLLARYNGNVAEAIGAYHDGPQAMDAVLAGRATLSTAGQAEVASVMSRMGQSGDVNVGGIVIHITQQPGESNQDLARRLKTEMQDAANKRVQRNLMNGQDLSPSY